MLLQDLYKLQMSKFVFEAENVKQSDVTLFERQSGSCWALTSFSHLGIIDSKPMINISSSFF